MKKYSRVLILYILILILTSCSQQYSDNLRINFKNDKSLNYGYAAAVYQDRIYYISNELGVAGIYSMMVDGTDVNLEEKHQDITGLQVQDGLMYFNGIYRILDQRPTVATGTINNHTLYYMVFDKGITDILYCDNINHNLKSFFISQNGYSFFKYGAFSDRLYLYDPAQKESFSNLKNKVATISFEYVDVETFKSDYYDTKTDGEENLKEVQKTVYEFGDNLIIAEQLPIEDERNIFINEDPYVLNSNTGELVLAYDYVQAEALKAFYMDEKNIYCSYKEMMVILDRITYQIKTTFIPERLPEEYNITYMTKYGDSIYVIADYWRDQDRKVLPLMGEKLYIMDTETFEISEVLDLGSDQRIIGIDKNYIILLDNETIYKMSLENGKIGHKKKICYAPSDINNKNHIIDYAGDWMFIYKSYPENGAFTYGSDLPGQQLLMKVNLATGEIINNNVKLDFSALDIYKKNN